ncbi:DUF58 domain-containing protein [Halorubrum lipolyticum]|uniref:DUF58 domain-containing protein n=1 Tax=Halorubrum lipolyticum DSM 21995 TaxID=1227482 RepID=M0NZD9_9EURY|nr:DUF58 domain-containing protein [Halorubrum lipolyticum]EMA61925.1 hypothetical protein C469_05712 [Halorubrum lipolyticum DSM 21995]
MTDEWLVETSRRTEGIAVVGLFAVAVGAATGTGATLLLAVPLVGFALYDRLTTLNPPELACERALETERPLPGRKVTVTLTVSNEGERNVPDLRVVDGVPGPLAVVDGSPRAGLSLAPGESASFEYAVRTRRGSFEFEPATLIARNLSGSRRARRTDAVETTIDCRVHPETYALDDRASLVSGMLDTTRGGAGVEFHSTREYHSTDPANRIDWRRLARSGDLTTVTYRESRAATVQLVVDRGPGTDVSYAADGLTHAEYATYAAEMVAEMLLGSHHRVGLTTLGDTRNAIRPSTGDEHRLSLRRLFEGLDGAGADRPDPTATADELADMPPNHTQFTLISPVADDEFVELATRLRAHGKSVVVLSPRQPRAETDGQRILLADRALRLDDLRRNGVTVFDWDTAEPLRIALEHRFGGAV